MIDGFCFEDPATLQNVVEQLDAGSPILLKEAFVDHHRSEARQYILEVQLFHVAV